MGPLHATCARVPHLITINVIVGHALPMHRPCMDTLLDARRALDSATRRRGAAEPGTGGREADTRALHVGCASAT